METIETTPVPVTDVASTPQSSAATEVTVAEKATTTTPAVSEKPKSPIHDAVQNAKNAQRRIQNNKYRDELRSLQQRIEELEAKDTPEAHVAKRDLEREYNVYDTISRKEMNASFEAAAESTFGARAPQFMEQTYKYAEYVNNNEPDLLKYLDKPYGMILLSEWYQRMDNPELARQWKSFTQYEKGMVLNRFYTEIEGLSSQPVKAVPAPSGGRSTNVPPVDDFGAQLLAAQNRFTRK